MNTQKKILFVLLAIFESLTFFCFNSYAKSNSSPLPVNPVPIYQADAVLAYESDDASGNLTTLYKIAYINDQRGTLKTETIDIIRTSATTVRPPVLVSSSQDLVLDPITNEIHTSYVRCISGPIAELVYAHKQINDAVFTYEIIPFMHGPAQMIKDSKIVLHSQSSGTNILVGFVVMGPVGGTFQYSYWLAERVGFGNWRIENVINMGGQYGFGTASISLNPGQNSLNVDYMARPSPSAQCGYRRVSVDLNTQPWSIINERDIFATPAGNLMGGCDGPIVLPGMNGLSNSTPGVFTFGALAPLSGISSNRIFIYDFQSSNPLLMIAPEARYIATKSLDGGSVTINAAVENPIAADGSRTDDLAYYLFNGNAALRRNLLYSYPRTTSTTHFPTIDVGRFRAVISVWRNSSLLGHLLEYYSVDVQGNILNSHIIRRLSPSESIYHTQIKALN